MKKFITVSLVGKPNSGKSTLLNSIINQKISIVSHKTQTTRTSIKGIFTKDDLQAVFVDTPGIFEINKKRKLERLIVENARQNADSCDLACVIISPDTYNFDDLKKTFQLLKVAKIVVLINKIDLLSQEKLNDLYQEIETIVDRSNILPISSLHGFGLNTLIDVINNEAKPGEWHFNEDQVTDASIKKISEDFTRETIFFLLQRELPYAIEVKTEQWLEEEGKVEIFHVIYVNKDSQKAIILGKAGDMITKIRVKSQKKIRELMQKEVKLRIFVKVRKDWIDMIDLTTE